MISIDWLRPHIKQANNQHAGILASRDGHVEWRGGQTATIDECPGGVIVTFNKTITVCTEEQLSQVLVVIGRELVE
jgi:hypothetical protein